MGTFDWVYVAIEANRAGNLNCGYKSTLKHERELNKIFCAINYDVRSGSAS